MSVERWKPVVGYEGLYEVSDRGSVRSVARVTPHGHSRKGRPIKPLKTTNGYLKVPLYRGGKCRQWLVHRLVLTAFVGPRPAGLEACHYNGERTDNRLANLRWDTRANNHADKRRHGTQQDMRGVHNGQAKLNETGVERIFDLKRAGCTQSAIAAWLGVSPMTISSVVRRKRWAHVGLA